MSQCLFCGIIAGAIPSTKVYEDEWTYAFRDIHPQMPTHVIVVPKQHVSGMSEIDQLDDQALAACLRAARQVALQEGLTEGYRVISNCGAHACQSVQHLHFHVLGGAQMADKMG